MAMLPGVVNKGLIGKGAFGCVYLVENWSGEQFAVKVMKWLDASLTEKEVVDNELNVLQQLSHENVLVYVDHLKNQGLMFIITEYCSGGDLSGFLDETGRPLPEDLLKVWLWQMACGLEYMHKHDDGPVLHRDLKPSNVYLSDKGHIRLGDMGIARVLESPTAMADTFCGTPPYMSPEALSQKPYNAKTDIWSLGCCVVEMATLERAYDGASIYILQNVVMKTRQPLPPEYSRELDQMVSNMLIFSFDDRSSASEILDDPFLDGCEDDLPMDLLLKHNLHKALAMHRRASLPSTAASSMTTGMSVARDDEVLTLTDTMANIKVILGEGEPITTYRVKLEVRMRGRRPDDDTLMNTATLKTVLYKTQTMKAKTMKKTLKVPTKVKPPSEPDDTLSRRVISSMSTTLMTVRQTRKCSRRKSDGAHPASPLVSGDASRSTQMEVLRDTLAQVIGQDTLQQARRLLQTASSRQEIQRGLAPLVGECTDMLSSVIIYLLLMESVMKSTSSI